MQRARVAKGSRIAAVTQAVHIGQGHEAKRGVKVRGIEFRVPRTWGKDQRHVHGSASCSALDFFNRAHMQEVRNQPGHHRCSHRYARRRELKRYQ